MDTIKETNFCVSGASSHLIHQSKTKKWGGGGDWEQINWFGNLQLQGIHAKL